MPRHPLGHLDRDCQVQNVQSSDHTTVHQFDFVLVFDTRSMSSIGLSSFRFLAHLHSISDVHQWSFARTKDGRVLLKKYVT